MTPQNPSLSFEHDERRGPDREGHPHSRVIDRYENIVRVFGSDAAAAEALNVNLEQPDRWREGFDPGPETRDRIVGLDAVLALLAGYLEPSTIPKWLTGVNAHLGDRRPLSALREGRLSDVVAAIEAEKGGAFT